MAQAADPDEPRDQANLLLARLGEVPRGASTVLLEGFGGEEVRISLDPSLNPQENATALYQEAARRERVRDRLPPLLAEAEREVRELKLLGEELERGAIPPATASARIPGRKPSPGPGRKQETRSPFRRYLSSGGLEIRVGRSSRENDLLTFRHSHPEDVWLHARDRAGAHVVLRWREEGNPPHRDLAEAAILAAVFSGARTSGTVPVDWTRRKYVRKPRKAPPGTVLPDRSKTLFVEPDPELPSRLRWSEGEGEEG
jgi:predicted ribosome quality control (RQC) complex YloA/Tae2 family protein